MVKPKTPAWKGNVVGGDRPNLAFVLTSWQKKIGDGANERHTGGRLSAGSPAKATVLRDSALLSPCAGTVTPLQRGGHRWEVMWTAEIIADRKTSLLPAREEESHQRREAASGWDSITLSFYEF